MISIENSLNAFLKTSGLREYICRLNGLKLGLDISNVSGATKGEVKKFEYFNFVDVLRGIAALAILIFHYSHFYFKQAGDIFTNRSVQPFYSSLKFIYDNGHIAVELFWVISGFVFASVYFYRESSSKQFFIHRFARLYPLHFLTLCLVASLQLLSMFFVDHFQIYENTDVYHFFLNLFMVSHWGFQHGYSFNGPFWSVSVEIFSYIVFFFSLKTLKRNRLVYSVSYTVLFLLLNQHLPILKSLTNCAYYFFLGTTVFGVIRVLRNRVSIIFFLAIVCLTASYFIGKAKFLSRDHLSVALPGILLLFSGLDLLPRLRILSKRIRKIGDLSYSVYLFHVPLQIIVLIIIQYFAIDTSLFNNPAILFIFIAVTYFVAYLSFTYFENPMRKRINDWARPATMKQKKEN